MKQVRFKVTCDVIGKNSLTAVFVYTKYSNAVG